MVVPPGNTHAMAAEEIVEGAVRWICKEIGLMAGNTAFLAAGLFRGLIPHGYVEILRDPDTGDEWLHYGDRWMGMNLTDTSVKLAPRAERAEFERESLRKMEEQLEAQRKACEEQRRRVTRLETPVPSKP